MVAKIQNMPKEDLPALVSTSDHADGLRPNFDLYDLVERDAVLAGRRIRGTSKAWIAICCAFSPSRSCSEQLKRAIDVWRDGRSRPVVGLASIETRYL